MSMPTIEAVRRHQELYPLIEKGEGTHEGLCWEHGACWLCRKSMLTSPQFYPSILRLRARDIVEMCLGWHQWVPLDTMPWAEGAEWEPVDQRGHAIAPEALEPSPDVIDATEPVSAWFELSYAQFLTVPRIFMERMPAAWQRRIVACLRELDAAFDWRPKAGNFWVTLRSDEGRFVPLDPNICNYRRGDVEHLRLPAGPMESVEPPALSGEGA